MDRALIRPPPPHLDKIQKKNSFFFVRTSLTMNLSSPSSWVYSVVPNQPHRLHTVGKNHSAEDMHASNILYSSESMTTQQTGTLLTTSGMEHPPLGKASPFPQVLPSRATQRHSSSSISCSISCSMSCSTCFQVLVVPTATLNLLCLCSTRLAPTSFAHSPQLLQPLQVPTC